jgi:hypothetical protein
LPVSRDYLRAKTFVLGKLWAKLAWQIVSGKFGTSQTPRVERPNRAWIVKSRGAKHLRGANRRELDGSFSRFCFSFSYLAPWMLRQPASCSDSCGYRNERGQRRSPQIVRARSKDRSEGIRKHMGWRFVLASLVTLLDSRRYLGPSNRSDDGLSSHTHT